MSHNPLLGVTQVQMPTSQVAVHNSYLLKVDQVTPALDETWDLETPTLLAGAEARSS